MIKTQKNIGLTFGLLGLVILSLNIMYSFENVPLFFSLCFLSMTLGGILYFKALYGATLSGIQNNGVWFNALTAKGLWGWILGLVLTCFYIAIYWFPELLGYRTETASVGLVAFFDPLSVLLNGKLATQWFMYGTLYTFAILLFGIKFIWKYRSNPYQIFRTLSVVFFQLCFAFLLPELLSKLNPEMPYFSKDIKNMWPLNYYFFDAWHLEGMLNGKSIGQFFLIFGLLMIFVISPLLTYRFGKRWYCSWVCGCGGLAETAGDPFRQLSSKKISVWKLERWMIHFVLVFVFITTVAVVWSFLGTQPELSLVTKERFILGVVVLLLLILLSLFIKHKNGFPKDAKYTLISVVSILLASIGLHYFSGQQNIFFFETYTFQKWYGFGIGAAFSGVLGVGFYPLLGSRVWCRFGCPMAALLGLQQRLFSRFRITTNGGQCISCGNCSTYCEMGIDVRAYAQRGANIVRSSCVGCGICSAVCPRGVLKLENGPLENRITNPTFPLGNTL
jgi:Pyruvate/2-oxoacid:ferredoxin oxidoreductase delta subunit